MSALTKLLHRRMLPEDLRTDLTAGLQVLPGECLLCENRAQVQLAAEGETAMLCFDHLGDFVEIWSGPRTSFTLEKLT